MIKVIVGLPGVGKTTYMDKVKAMHTGYSIYHTDDYKNHGFEKSLYELMKDILNDANQNKIIEGVQAYRLLRKGLQTKSFYADEVITCICSNELRHQRYWAREQKKPNAGFDKTLFKIWTDYLEMLEHEVKSKWPKLSIVNT